jgi:hypothetical protein
MKIRIEPLSRTSARLTECHVEYLPSGKGEYQLALSLQLQLRKNWCWAAVASSICAYYKNDNWPQLKVAWRMLDDTFDANKPVPEKIITELSFDQRAQLEQALQQVGCLASWSGARPPFRNLMRELDAGRPLAVAIYWGTGGQHYVLIDGYDRHNRTISIKDPQIGHTIFSFDRFPQDYRDGGEWAETYWTTRPPTSGSTGEETHEQQL